MLFQKRNLTIGNQRKWIMNIILFLLIFFIFSCNQKQQGEVFISDCNLGSEIRIQNNKKAIFKGRIIVNKVDTIAYEAMCADFLISESEISFNLINYKFETPPIASKSDLEIEFYLGTLLPHNFKGSFNKNNSTIQMNITRKIALSNAEKCEFELLIK